MKWHWHLDNDQEAKKIDEVLWYGSGEKSRDYPTWYVKDMLIWNGIKNLFKQKIVDKLK